MPGKAKHWCWRFFESVEEVIDGKKKITATCKFCPAHYGENATDMANYLTKQCKNIGEETRKTINRLAGIKQNTDEPPLKIAKRTESSTPGIASFMDRVSEGEQAEIDILLTGTFATGNISANFLDSPFFKQMMNKMRHSIVTKQISKGTHSSRVRANQKQFGGSHKKSRLPSNLIGWLVRCQPELSHKCYRARAAAISLYNSHRSHWSTRRSSPCKSLLLRVKEIGRSEQQSIVKLGVETASKLTFIKHNLMLEHADLFKKQNPVYKADEQGSEESVEEETENEEETIVEEIDEF